MSKTQGGVIYSDTYGDGQSITGDTLCWELPGVKVAGNGVRDSTHGGRTSTTVRSEQVVESKAAYPEAQQAELRRERCRN